MGIFSFFSKEKKETLDKGLSKTKENVFTKIARAIAGKSKVDDEVLDNLEEVLITSDVGVDTTLKIISRIEKRVASDKFVNTQELTAILRDEIASLLTENNTEDTEGFTTPDDKKPYVIMVVGVNGVGKTTTIGKLAYQFKKAGKKVSFFKDIVCRPLWAFIKVYFLNGGFKDGRLGWILSVDHYFYTMTKYVKLYYLYKSNGKL